MKQFSFFRCYSIFMLRFWYCGWSE